MATTEVDKNSAKMFIHNSQVWPSMTMWYSEEVQIQGEFAFIHKIFFHRLSPADYKKA